MSLTADTAALGLTSEEAACPLAADGNELATARRRNGFPEAWDLIRQPVPLMLLGAGMGDFQLVEWLDGAVLMAFVPVVIAYRHARSSHPHRVRPS